MNPIRNSRGTSLIELMVATAILAIVVMAVNGSLISQLQSVNFVEDKLSQNSLKMDLQNLLAGDVAACNMTLNGFGIPAVGGRQVPVIIRDKNGNPIYDPANANRNSYDKLNITGITFSNVSVFAANSTGTVQFNVTVARKRSGGGPSSLKTISVNATVTSGFGMEFRQCGSIGTQLPVLTFAAGSTSQCPAGTSATGCSAEGDKSCVPTATPNQFNCASSGPRGARCYLFCRP